jgi:hypothetical protein
MDLAEVPVIFSHMISLRILWGEPVGIKCEAKRRW